MLVAWLLPVPSQAKAAQCSPPSFPVQTRAPKSQQSIHAPESEQSYSIMTPVQEDSTSVSLACLSKLSVLIAISQSWRAFKLWLRSTGGSCRPKVSDAAYANLVACKDKSSHIKLTLASFTNIGEWFKPDAPHDYIGQELSTLQS